MLLHVEYWLAELRILLYDEGLGDLDVKMLLCDPCRLANSAIEPVSTGSEELVRLYAGLGDRLTRCRPFSGLFCWMVCTSFKGFVTKSFFPLRRVVTGLAGIFSSKFIGKVLDFFTGSMGRLGGAMGGFLGVASKMGGDRGPLEDPLTGGENVPL